MSPTRSVPTLGGAVAAGVLVLGLVLEVGWWRGATAPLLAGLEVVTSAAALAATLVAGLRLGGRAGALWLLTAATIVAWVVSDAVWAAPFADPGGSPAGMAVVLGGYVTALLALRVAAGPRPRWGHPAVRRRFADVVVLTACALLICALVVFRPYLAAAVGFAEGAVVVVPVLSLAVAGVALVVSTLATQRGVALELLAASYAVLAAADLASLAVMTGGVDPSAWVAPGYCAASVLVTAAASSAMGLPGDFAPAVAKIGRRVLAAIPEVVVVSSLTIAIVLGLRTWYEWVLAGLCVAGVAIRATMTAMEARQTREGLESQVAARTAELSQLTARYVRILDTVREGIVGLDDRARVSFVNAAAGTLLGIDREQVIGLPACEVLCTHAADDACPLIAVARRGEVIEGWETELRRRVDVLPVELDAAPKTWPGAQGAHGAVVAFRDISERLVVEQVKHQFVSSVSHELRTPLASIRGVLEMLADGDVGELSPTAHRLVANAERGVERLTRLVNDIIDVEKLAAGDFDVTPAPHGLGEVVGDAVASLRPLAAQSEVEVRVTDLDAVEVLCDADRVEQALVNLVGNAVKFSEPGGFVEVAVRAGEAEVEVSVRDHGRGIPAADLDHVFDRFRQVQATDATEKGGTGLGLTITRSIVERHGGRIWVESTEGIGTTFTFTLPRAAVVHRPAEGSVEALSAS